MALTPRHCTIIAVDIEKYSDRPEPVQASLRAALHQTMRDACESSGVVWAECDVLERGDSVIVLVPPTVTPAVLVTVFIERLNAELRQQAAIRSPLARIRLRAALHHGYVSPDAHGHVGDAINETARLLDSDVLRYVLTAAKNANLVVILSDELYRGVVHKGHGGADPNAYREVAVDVKSFHRRGWITVPGLPIDPLPPDAYPPPPATPPDPRPEQPTGSDHPASPTPATIYRAYAGRDVVYGSVTNNNGPGSGR